MSNECILVEQSLNLKGEAKLVGAKNAVLVIMASLLLADGESKLYNVPNSQDVLNMIKLLESLGAKVFFDSENNFLQVDTFGVNKYHVSRDIMKEMRASFLVMGPLLARFGSADIALPGGCVIGSRPIDYHLKGFERMGVHVDVSGECISTRVGKLQANKIVLEYPSVGATENVMMAATLTQGVTRIINAAIEPEVLDLIDILRKMGANIAILPAATIEITGVSSLNPVEHNIVFDRLEAGALLLAAAITGGEIYLPDAPAFAMDIFLMKLQEMGHKLEIGVNDIGIRLKATSDPKAVSFKTGPYPGFPTDLQAPMMAAQCLADGTSVVCETVFENRLLHVRELQKMGAQIKVDHDTAIITGVEKLYGASVIATDIRASCALVLAGFVAEGQTVMTGVHHFKRGYDSLDKKLQKLGASIIYKSGQDYDDIFNKININNNIKSLNS
ncbi:MAG: UDP-N-acetylglucosamine enolpyruvyl transferase [candidate division TM6 bacterium GW2011_GWF2_30_66]|nr:MAG: UDP-N-acetylglucosamine enolpyruvyl transferase [candidate division TM6 bacterium GW2011_GWF2_30_66]